VKEEADQCSDAEQADGYENEPGELVGGVLRVLTDRDSPPDAEIPNTKG
jgi:hypothetical protein